MAKPQDFLKDIIKTTGNEYATLADAGIESGDVTDFIDTGSYIFNALLSGSIHGGLPQRSEERRVGKECRSRWSPSH